jgi:hypothetical protein
MKKILTDDEKIEYHNEIYCECLKTLHNNVVVKEKKDFKGSAAMMTLMERARNEMIGLRKKGRGSGSSGVFVLSWDDSGKSDSTDN